MISKFAICPLNYVCPELIKLFRDQAAIKNILGNKRLSVLDIGCRNPQSLYILYHDLGFDILEGIELTSQEDAVNEFLRAINLNYDKTSTTIYDLYLKYLLFDGTELTGRTTHLNQPEFAKKFNVRFNTEAHQYFQEFEGERKFHLIILSDVLHLMPYVAATNLLRYVTKSLSDKGLLYVKVNHNDNPVAQEKGHYSYMEKQFLALFDAHYEPIHFCKNLVEDSDLVRSIVYLGWKTKKS